MQHNYQKTRHSYIFNHFGIDFVMLIKRMIGLNIHDT
ncbi:MAG: hypothetical protein ACJAQ0_000695 [Dasania sp.]|jgi:hypothetical protein